MKELFVYTFESDDEEKSDSAERPLTEEDYKLMDVPESQVTIQDDGVI